MFRQEAAPSSILVATYAVGMHGIVYVELNFVLTYT